MACTCYFCRRPKRTGQHKEGKEHPPTHIPSFRRSASRDTHTYIHTHNDIQIHFSSLAAVVQDRSFHLFFWPQLPVLELVFTYIVHPFRASIGFV